MRIEQWMATAIEVTRWLALALLLLRPNMLDQICSAVERMHDRKQNHATAMARAQIDAAEAREATSNARLVEFENELKMELERVEYGLPPGWPWAQPQPLRPVVMRVQQAA